MYSHYHICNPSDPEWSAGPAPAHSITADQRDVLFTRTAGGR